jgi:hypothetical protein
MFIVKSGNLLSKVCFSLAFAILSYNSTLLGDEFVLTVSDERALAIEEIVTTMGQTNVILLKLKEPKLKEISKKLKGMGSFNFLGYIFIHPELKSQMLPIEDSMFKFNAFMNSVKKGFDRDKANGTLYEQISGFADLVRVDAAKLKKYAEKSDWDGLVKYLIKETR